MQRKREKNMHKEEHARERKDLHLLLCGDKNKRQAQCAPASPCRI